MGSSSLLVQGVGESKGSFGDKKGPLPAGWVGQAERGTERLGCGSRGEGLRRGGLASLHPPVPGPSPQGTGSPGLSPPFP